MHNVNRRVGEYDTYKCSPPNTTPQPKVHTESTGIVYSRLAVYVHLLCVPNDDRCPPPTEVSAWFHKVGRERTKSCVGVPLMETEAPTNRINIVL